VICANVQDSGPIGIEGQEIASATWLHESSILSGSTTAQDRSECRRPLGLLALSVGECAVNGYL